MEATTDADDRRDRPMSTNPSGLPDVPMPGPSPAHYSLDGLYDAIYRDVPDTLTARRVQPAAFDPLPPTDDWVFDVAVHGEPPRDVVLVPREHRYDDACRRSRQVSALDLPLPVVTIINHAERVTLDSGLEVPDE